jgi:capsular exopolysaccharide synthesis family protein
MTDQQENLHFLDYWRIITSRKEIVIAVSLIVVITGFIITMAMPKVYMASAVIRVRDDSASDISPFGPEMMNYDPLYLRTQFEIIQSRPVIEEVIERLDLVKKLAAACGYEEWDLHKKIEQTYKIVANAMNVQQYRDTNLIEIQVAMSEPKVSAPHEAAETANMIAKVFQRQTEERSRRATENALEALHDTYLEQDQRYRKAKEKVEKIRDKYKLDVVNSSGGSSASLDKLTITMLEELKIRAKQDLAEIESKYSLVESLPDDKLLAAAAYLVKDPSIPQLVADKRKAEIDLSMMRESYGPKHPDIVRAKRIIASLDAKIADALSGLKTGVLANYKASQAKLNLITVELTERRDIDRKKEAGSYREFANANDELMRIKKIRDALEMRYFQEQIKLRIPKTSVDLISKAKPPSKDDYISPNKLLNILLSIIAGLGAGIGLAYFVEYLDTSVKTIDEIERNMELPVLGVIPQKVIPMNEPGANPAHAEPYRILRTNIQFSQKYKDGKTLCLTSGSMGEGKSLTMFNLAYACAQLGDKVIVIDSDLHRPRQHHMFGVKNKLGLANILIGEAEPDDVIHKEVFLNMDFLPSGKLDSGVHGLLDTQRMRALIAELRDRYDRVFFDAPPIIGVSDASVLAREVDGVMLLIQHRKYPKAISERAKGMLDNMGTNLLGVVLNNINVSRDQSYYYYHQYYYQSDYTTKARKG